MDKPGPCCPDHTPYLVVTDAATDSEVLHTPYSKLDCCSCCSCCRGPGLLRREECCECTCSLCPCFGPCCGAGEAEVRLVLFLNPAGQPALQVDQLIDTSCCCPDRTPRFKAYSGGLTLGESYLTFGCCLKGSRPETHASSNSSDAQYLITKDDVCDCCGPLEYDVQCDGKDIGQVRTRTCTYPPLS